MGSIVAELAEKISSATNNFSVDAQVLYVDTVNDEVGVNTTTPDGAFSIHQSGTDDIFNLYDGTDNVTTVVDGGALTHKGTLTVGVDDTGHDVVFYGATSGKSWVWDESEDKMTVNGTTELIGGITATGNVGIGESTPLFKLHVNGTLGIKTAQPTLTFDRGGAYAWTIRNGDGTGSFPLSTLNIVNNGGSPKMTFLDNGYVGISVTAPGVALDVAGAIRATSDITAYHSSDIALKENISPISNALTKLDSLNGVCFDWTDEHINSNGGPHDYFMQKRDVGIIAQELKEVLPEAVRQREDGILAVKYDGVIPLLIQAIKELKSEINSVRN